MKKTLLFLGIFFCSSWLVMALSPQGLTLMNQPDDSLYPLVKKNTYRIVVAFPFGLNQIFTTSYKPNSVSKSAVEFYQGMLCAGNKFDTSSSTVRIEIIPVEIPSDDKPDEATLMSILQHHPDIIICYLSRNNSDDFFKISSENKITLISIFYACEKNLKNNPYFISLKSSDNMMETLISRYIYDSLSSKNLVLLCQTQQQLNEFSHVLKNTGNIARLKNFSGFMVNSSNWSSTEYISSLEEENLIVTNIVNDMVSINSILTNLTKQYNKQIQLMAPYEWLSYPAIELASLDLLNSLFYTDPVISFEDNSVADFIQAYRKIYFTDPGNFSFKGYQLLSYLVEAFQEQGRYIQRYQSDHILSFSRFGDDKGWQNDIMELFLINDHRLTRLGTLKY